MLITTVRDIHPPEEEVHPTKPLQIHDCPTRQGN